MPYFNRQVSNTLIRCGAEKQSLTKAPSEFIYKTGPGFGDHHLSCRLFAWSFFRLQDCFFKKVQPLVVKPVRLSIAGPWTGTDESLALTSLKRCFFAYREKIPTGAISVGPETAKHNAGLSKHRGHKRVFGQAKQKPLSC